MDYCGIYKEGTDDDSNDDKYNKIQEAEYYDSDEDSDEDNPMEDFLDMTEITRTTMITR